MPRMRWPLDRIFITQYFGANPNQPPYGALGHTGIDLRTRFVDSPLGNREVSAPADGIVVTTTFQPKGYGNYVLIRHDDEMSSLCAHLNTKFVEGGARVHAGDRIGISGSTGWSSGEHVHFEVRDRDGRALNPMPFVDPSEIDRMPVDSRYGKARDLAAEWAVRSFKAPQFVTLVRPLRPPTTREINAMTYGGWSPKEVVDPAMFELWSVQVKK